MSRTNSLYEEILNTVSSVNPEKYVKNIIYSEIGKPQNLSLIKITIKFKLAMTNIVYQFDCPVQDCVSCHNQLPILDILPTP